ncbi:MAG: hypothetical protein JST82_00695 [Bacteroidetes bacterium]|nr:hypothetical protein [Bacteroidota bacterium]
MQKVLSILLLCSLCFQCFLKLGIIAWYNANKTYVATVLCENRDKPQMKCCGKCYLRKQLKKADMQGTTNSSKNHKTEQVEWTDFLPEDIVNLSFTSRSALVAQNGTYIPPLGCNMPLSIFHPPPVV